MKNNIYNLATYIQDRAKESDPRGVKKKIGGKRKIACYVSQLS